MTWIQLPNTINYIWWMKLKSHNYFGNIGMKVKSDLLVDYKIEKIIISTIQRHQSVRCKPFLCIRGFAIVCRDDIYAMQSQLRDRQSGIGVEPLTFELGTEEPNPLAITAKQFCGF